MAYILPHKQRGIIYYRHVEKYKDAGKWRERSLGPATYEEYKRYKMGMEAMRKKKNMPDLYCADARALPLEDACIDLIITSPPYNLHSERWPMGGNGRTPRPEGIGYDDDLPESVYQSQQLAALKELYRVSREGASLFYNHKIRQVNGSMIHPLDWLRHESNPWIIRQEIVWNRKSTHNHCPSLFWPQTERVYWMTKGEPTLPNKPIGMADIWTFFGPVPNTSHPAPFQDKLPHLCLDALGRPGITVLDPFGGSMTTVRVALLRGYHAIGVDIDQSYLDEAKRVNKWT